MKQVILPLIFIIFSALPLFSVNSPEHGGSFTYAGLRTHYGFIIPHSEKIRGISNSNPRGIEFDIGRHHTGNRAWEYCFCYPRTGLMLSWFDFDNPEILGNAWIITPYIEPVISAGNLVSVSVKTGIGAAYLDNIYDPVTNPLNHFYSTHFSFLVFLNFNLNFRISENLNLKAGGYYNHISNGGNRQPNKGINYPTASLGIDYYFRPVIFPERTREDYIREKQKSSAFRFSLFFTTKEVSKEDGKQYPVFGFSPKYSRLLGRLSAVSGGFEFVSDGALKEHIDQLNSVDSDHKRLSVFAGHELLIGRFNFYQELGVYLYSPYKAKDPVYQRYGLEYFFHPNISTGLSFKSHRHVADFLDVRLTYTL